MKSALKQPSSEEEPAEYPWSVVKDKVKLNLTPHEKILHDSDYDTPLVTKAKWEKQRTQKSKPFNCNDECAPLLFKKDKSKYNECIEDCVTRKTEEVHNKQLNRINAEKEAETAERSQGIINTDDIQKIIDFLVEHHYNDDSRKQKLIDVLFKFKQENPEYPDIVQDILELFTLLYERYSRNKISKTLFSNRSRFFRRIDHFIDNLEDTLVHFKYKESIQSNFHKLLLVKGGRKTRKHNQKKSKTKKNHQKKTKRKINKSRKRI